MKKDKKTMKNKEPKLNEVEIRYQDDRVILGKHIEQDLTWVFVQPYDDGNWKGCATLEFDFDADGWWHGSKLFDSHKEISEFWQSELGMNLYAKEQAARQREIDSLINAHICEVSEGMMSLSHVG